jgi:magnesium chelatase subunit D
VGDRAPTGPIGSVAVGPTLRAASSRRAAHADPTLDVPLVAPGDLREAVREERAGNLVILAVDASGSMGAVTRMEAAKGAVLGLLLDAYQRRDRVALVTFRGDGAEIALRPTGSVEVARARLGELPTGGRTPLAAGITTALGLAAQPQDRPLLVLVSDGRATAAPDGVDPLVAAKDAAAEVRRRGVPAVVVDAEDGHIRLGLAAELADAMGARYLTLSQLSAGAVRALLPPG